MRSLTKVIVLITVLFIQQWSGRLNNRGKVMLSHFIQNVKTKLCLSSVIMPSIQPNQILLPVPFVSLSNPNLSASWHLNPVF